MTPYVIIRKNKLRIAWIFSGVILLLINLILVGLFFEVQLGNNEIYIGNYLHLSAWAQIIHGLLGIVCVSIKRYTSKLKKFWTIAGMGFYILWVLQYILMYYFLERYAFDEDVFRKAIPLILLMYFVLYGTITYISLTALYFIYKKLYVGLVNKFKKSSSKP